MGEAVVGQPQPALVRSRQRPRVWQARSPCRHNTDAVNMIAYGPATHGRHLRVLTGRYILPSNQSAAYRIRSRKLKSASHELKSKPRTPSPEASKIRSPQHHRPETTNSTPCRCAPLQIFRMPPHLHLFHGQGILVDRGSETDIKLLFCFLELGFEFRATGRRA